MADIDQIIAGGAGASSRADFSGIAKLADSYYKSRDEAAKNDLRDAFKGGVPTTPDGQPDFGAMAKVLFQKGGLNEGTAAANLGIAQQNQQFAQGQSSAIQQAESGGQPVSPPSSNRTAGTVVAPPLNRGGVQSGQSPQGQSAGPQGGATVMQVVAAQGIPNDQLGAVSASVARQLGVDPTAPIDLNDPQVRNVLVPAIAQIKKMGVGQVVPPGAQLGPQPIPPQVAQQGPSVQPASPQQPVPQSQIAQQAPGLASPATQAVTSTAPVPEPSRVDKMIAFYSGIMSDPRSPKQNVELAKTRLDALQKNTDLTPDQKNYAQAVSQGYKGTMQDFQTELESGKAGATEQAKADVKERQGIIDSGREAQLRLNTLNTVSNIINTDKDLTLGFGGDTALKVKKALQQIGIDVGDLSGAQTIEKLNAQLASEAAKSVSPRPAQFEFKTFLANNPGLSLDKAGNLRVLGIFSQLAKRDVDLARLARQNGGEGWQNWDNVVQSYDKQHPILDPTTKNVLSTDSVIAPNAPQQQNQPPALEPGKTMVNGHVYKGGNPNMKSSWELRT